MAAHVELGRRSDSNNDTTILIVVMVVVGVFVILVGTLLAIMIVRRRRRNSHPTLYPSSVPPMASYNHKSNQSTSSSFLPDLSSEWHRSSSSPQLSQKRLESDTNTRAPLISEAKNSWYSPSHYIPASHNTTSDRKPALHESSSEVANTSHYLSHSRDTSDSSTKPLLRDMNNGFDYLERPVPIHRTTQEEVFWNNPAGQYHVPVSRPASRESNYTPASSSFFHPGMDLTPSSDNPYLSRRSTPPTLPPLVIPQKFAGKITSQKSADKLLPPQIPPTVAEAPSQHSAGCTSSASSAYSQPTANSPPHPIHLTIQRDAVVSPELDSPEEGGDTAFVGTLLKARAERNPNGLLRGASHVSHIERNGSIKSVGGSYQSYPRRYRAKKSGRTEDMDTLRELSDRGSIQSPV